MIRVYDDEDTHEDIAAVVAREAAFRAAAEAIATEIRAEAAGHVETGRLARSIEMGQGKVDYFICTDGLAYDLHTEFGHFIYFDENGKLTRRENAVRKQWVQGIGVFRNVVARHGGY